MRLQLHLGHPRGDHVVVNRLVGGYFYQFHGSCSPVAKWRHPVAGTLLVVGVLILIVRKIAVALSQPKSARVLIGKTGDTQRFGIVQRAPQPLAAPGLHHETIAVVYFGAKIIERPWTVFA